MAEHTSQYSGDLSSTGALPPWWTKDTVAVVTGANRGIEFEIVRKLAVEGMTVVLTARDEGRGRKAAGDLHAANLKNVVFHQLDVADPDSVTEFAKWLKETYNGLDILNVKDEKLRQQLNDPHTFDQAFLNTIAERYLSASQSSSEDVHQYGFSSYYLSKTLLNAYTRLLAQSYPTLSVNCVDPGVVETDMLQMYIEHVTPEVYQEQLDKGLLVKDGPLSVEEGADTAVWLALRRLLPEEKATSGLFWHKRAVLSF